MSTFTRVWLKGTRQQARDKPAKKRNVVIHRRQVGGGGEAGLPMNEYGILHEWTEAENCIGDGPKKRLFMTGLPE